MTLCFVVSGSGGDGAIFSGDLVLDFIRFAVFRIDSTDKHVVSNIISIEAIGRLRDYEILSR